MALLVGEIYKSILSKMVEARQFLDNDESEEQKEASADLLVENNAAAAGGGSEEEGDNLPSSFYSQVPFSSQ